MCRFFTRLNMILLIAPAKTRCEIEDFKILNVSVVHVFHLQFHCLTLRTRILRGRVRIIRMDFFLLREKCEIYHQMVVAKGGYLYVSHIHHLSYLLLPPPSRSPMRFICFMLQLL